jgi:hypothetical protein
MVPGVKQPAKLIARPMTNNLDPKVLMNWTPFKIFRMFRFRQGYAF